MDYVQPPIGTLATHVPPPPPPTVLSTLLYPVRRVGLYVGNSVGGLLWGEPKHKARILAEVGALSVGGVLLYKAWRRR